LRVSNAQNSYRLWWSKGVFIYSIALPVDFAPPRALTAEGTGTFACNDETYYLETGFFDAAMPGYTKIASHLNITISGQMAGFDSAAELKVFYRTGPTMAWEELKPSGGIVSTGVHRLFFDEPAAEQHMGVPFEQIELRVELKKLGGSGRSPIIEDITMGFLKVIKSVFNWTAPIDLEQTHHDLSPDYLSAKLDALIVKDTFFSFIHYGQTYRVRLAQYSGTDSLGQDPRRRRTVSILEVPEGF
jgi:hypothetical protein